MIEDFIGIFIYLALFVFVIMGIMASATAVSNFFKKMSGADVPAGKNEAAAPKTSYSLLNIFFFIVLTVMILYLFAAIWSDLTRLVPTSYEIRDNPGLMLERNWSMPVKSSPGVSDQAAYLLNVLVWHTLFVLPLIIVAFLLYFEFYRRQPKYNTFILPFLVSSALTFLRLLVDVGYIITNQYQRAGTYLIIMVLIIVVSALAYLAQVKKEGENA